MVLFDYDRTQNYQNWLVDDNDKIKDTANT